MQKTKQELFSFRIGGTQVFGFFLFSFLSLLSPSLTLFFPLFHYSTWCSSTAASSCRHQKKAPRCSTMKNALRRDHLRRLRHDLLLDLLLFLRARCCRPVLQHLRCRAKCGSSPAFAAGAGIQGQRSTAEEMDRMIASLLLYLHLHLRRRHCLSLSSLQTCPCASLRGPLRLVPGAQRGGASPGGVWRAKERQSRRRREATCRLSRTTATQTAAATTTTLFLPLLSRLQTCPLRLLPHHHCQPWPRAFHWRVNRRRQ